MSSKVVVSTGKRKTSMARAVGHAGNGKVIINDIPLELIVPSIARLKIYEPVKLVGPEISDKVDIYVKVQGGGVMGQAEASRVVVSNILSNFGGEGTRRLLNEYDRRLLVSDARRTEPKKFGGHSARRRKQKSYR
jgi:small subunit ribosomal protein S9